MFNYVALLLIISLLSKSISDPIDISSEYEYPKKKTAEYIYVPIFGSNDVHGKIFAAQYTHPNGKDTYRSGGLEYLYAYKKILQSEWEGNLLWLDAGDQFQGGYEFTLSNASILHDYYNNVGLNAMAIGNHEFDFGTDFLREHYKKSNFPYLAANIRNTTTNKLFEWENVKYTEIFETSDGPKIGVIGLSTLLTPSTTSTNPQDLKFEPYLDIVKSRAQELRKQGADAIVLLAHFGPMCSDNYDLQNKFKIGIRNKTTKQGECDPGQEYNILLESLPEGTVDAVVAGHVHDVSHHWIGGVPVIESSGGEYSHVIYLPFEKTKTETGGYKLIKEKIQIEGPLPSCPLVFSKTLSCKYYSPGSDTGELTEFSFHGVKIEKDEKLAAILDPWRKIIDEKLGNVLFENEENLITNNSEETALTNLVTDIARRVTGADISIYNIGGIRSSWFPGKINEVDLFNMFPFNNTFVSFEMTGREVLRLLKDVQSGSVIYASSGVMQLLTYAQYSSFTRLKLIDVVLYDGYEENYIDLEKTYVIATNDFLANGGSGFGKVMKWYTPRNRIDHGIVRENMQMFLKKMKSIKKGTLVDKYHPRQRFLK